MRVIVTAAALIITPGVELKLTPEDAKLRKHCMTHVAGGVYRATLENHYKTGEIVEFAGDAIPKQYMTSVSPVDEQGKVLLPQSPAPKAAVVPKTDDAKLGPVAAEPLTAAQKKDVDEMTKAELLDFAEQRGVTVDASWNKAQIIAALKKKAA